MVDFVLLSGRLISVFVEDVAGYIEDAGSSAESD